MANNASAVVDNTALTDYFIHENGVSFAGRHLLVDLWDAGQLTDIDYIEDTLRRAADAAGATVLSVHLHQFSDSGGVSGVAILWRKAIFRFTLGRNATMPHWMSSCADRAIHTTLCRS